MPNQPFIAHGAAAAPSWQRLRRPSSRTNLRHRKQELTVGHYIVQTHVTEVVARIAPTPRRSHSTEPAADCAWPAPAEMLAAM
jgi:hypothetical protein